MRHLLCAFIVTGLSTHVCGAQGTVGGVVIDEAAQIPLVCVDVVAVGADSVARARARTDERGVFRLVVADTGDFRLELSAWGFNPVRTPTLRFDSTGYLESKFPVGLSPAIDSISEFSRFQAAIPPEGPNRPAHIRSRGSGPTYPLGLSLSGVEGGVFARFVVDEKGRVDPASIRVDRADAPEFAASVVRFLTWSSWDPGRRDGSKVCQLMGQLFMFKLER